MAGHERARTRLSRGLWFVLFWLAGVASVGFVAMCIRVLIG